jgi:hypothetical protein
MPLDREEYVEQAYFFLTLRERMQQNMSTQELFDAIRQEILATTMLPFALDFMASELRLTGGFSTAMARLPHYFTPFQTFVISEAERAEGRFDFHIALEILQREAEYRAGGISRQGIFLYQFETLCRNRLGYDRGLDAIANDDIYDEAWRNWIKTLPRQVGMVDFADILYVRSHWYHKMHEGEDDPKKPPLFGEKEGRIALANRRKDPLFLFSALQRQLGYPTVPRPRPEDTQRYLIPALQQKIDRLETRLALLEEELRGGINLSRFFVGKQEENNPPPKSS